MDRPPDAAVALREDVPAEPEVRRTPRAMPVKREYIEKFGITPGCAGCISVKRGFEVNKSNTMKSAGPGSL